jgi:hypothetical protein
VTVRNPLGASLRPPLFGGAEPERDVLMLLAYWDLRVIGAQDDIDELASACGPGAQRGSHAGGRAAELGAAFDQPPLPVLPVRPRVGIGTTCRRSLAQATPGAGPIFIGLRQSVRCHVVIVASSGRDGKRVVTR